MIPISAASLSGRPPLDAALASAIRDLPDAATKNLLTWLAHGPPPHLMIPRGRYEEFRLQPHALLPELSQELEALRRGTQERIVCVLDSAEDRGLDAVEARAVFDTWLRVDIAERAPLNTGFRLIVAGRFRDEHLGVAFTLDEACFTRQGRRQAIATLTPLADAGIVPAVLFLSARSARRLTRTRWGRLARLVRQFASAGTRPGAVVPAITAGGFADAPIHVRAVRSAWPVRARGWVVQYEAPPIHAEEVEKAHKGVREAQDVFDASVPAGTPVDRQNLARWGSYLEAGAYTPQRFDLRTPAGRWGDDSIVELVRVPYANGLRATWQATRLSRWASLERLLDYFRIESYLRRISDVSLAQQYHEFFVFNWGTGDPTPRTTLIDCGPLSQFDDARTLAREWRQLREQIGPRCHTDPEGFFDAALKEAKARTVPDVPSAIGLQHAEHHYLEASDNDGPLRADVADFIQALPPSLGRTLEIGAGFGRLAAELTTRASRYVTVDLETSMVQEAGRAARSGGAVADFHQLPFGDASFDSVLANNVLEHAYDPARALSEIWRMLRPGGALYALIPLDGLNPSYRLPAHLWKADLHGIRAAAAAAGLDVEAADAISLYALAIPASFPSCDGLVCRLRARRKPVPTGNS